MDRQIVPKTQKTAARSQSPRPQSGRSAAHPLLELQRSLGIQAVQRLIGSPYIQTKLTVSTPGDPYEQEADRVAETVMRMPAPTTSSQTTPEGECTCNGGQGTCPKCIEDHETELRKPDETSLIQRQEGPKPDREDDEDLLQTKENPGGTQATSSSLETQLSTARGSGQPLSPPLRAFFEPRFGVDFSHVRTHTGADAIQMNRAVGAKAFTHGSEIYYGTGYSPTNLDITAHELTHVVQQTGSAPAAIYRDPVTRRRAGSGDTPAGEAEAPFEPVITSGGMDFALLGGVVDAPARVTNSRKAPRGTTFRWGWKDGSVDPEKLEAQPTRPAEGPRATLHLKTKQVFESALPVPSVDVDIPGRGRSRYDGEPVNISVLTPEVQFLVIGPSAGAGGPGEERSTSRMFVGDSIQISGDIEQADDARGSGTEMLTTALSVDGGKVDIETTTWKNNLMADQTIVALRAGSVLVSTSMLIPGVENPVGEYQEAIKIVTDPQQFIDQCNLANTHLNEGYSNTEVFIRTASGRYKEGYDAHKAALDRQSARDQLTQQFILQVIFSAVGGGAGAAVGSLLKTFADKSLRNTTLTGVVTELTTNAASIVAPVITGPPGAGGQPAPARDSGTGVIATGGATGGGASAAAAIDPFTWHNGALTVLARERGEAFRLLGHMHEAAINARNRRADFQANFDPNWVVTEELNVAGQNLWELTEADIPSALDYERSLWEAWLSQFAYRLSTDEVWSAEEDVGKDLREEIDRVAKHFGESGQDWIIRYGAPIREKHARTARERNTSGPYGSLPLPSGPKW